MRRNLKEYFKQKGYSDEQINNHYKMVEYLNKRNKEKLIKEIEEHKEEIEKTKKYLTKVKPSLVGDGLWGNNEWNVRIFVRYTEIF